MEAYAGGRQKTSSDNFDDLDLERPSTKPIDPEELDDNDLRHKLITPLGQQKKTTAIKINLHTDSRKLAETKPPIPPPLPKLPPHTPNFIPLGFSPLGHPPPPPLRLPHMNPLGGHMGSSLGLPFGAPIGLNLAPPLGFSLNPLPPRGVLPGSHIIAPTPVEIVEQPKKEDKPKLPAAAVDKQEKLKELRQTLAITIYQAAELDKHSYRGPLFKRTTSNPNLFLCHICNIKVLNNDVVNHHKGKKHTSNLASVEIVNLKSDKEVDPKEPEIPGVESVIREVPLCQAMLDAFIDSPLIGLEYLVELLDKEDENCHVVCFLCDKRGESLMQNVRQNIISHMIGTTHRMNYLKRHFPRAHEALIGVQNSKDLKLETGRFVRLVIEAIEKEYGRLKPILADSRTFRVRCNEYKELTENAKHFSETPTKTFTELIGPIKRSPSVECVELSPVRRVRRSRSPNRRARSRSPSIRWNSSPGRSTSPGRSRSSEQRRSPVRRRGQSYRSNVRREKSISLSPEGGSSRMSPFDERIQCRKESATFDEESGQEVVEIHPNGKKTTLDDALRDTIPISRSGSDMSMSPEPISPRIAPIISTSRRHSPHFGRSRSPKLDQYGREVSMRRDKRSRSPDSRRGHYSRRSRSPKRSRKSLSCSPISSRSGSDSPRPMSRTSDAWSSSSKPASYGEKYKRECELIEREIKKKRRHYQTQPEKHPAYNDEWKLFWNRKQQEVKQSGRNPAKYDYTPEWKVFWNERVEDLYIRELQERKSELKKRMSFADESNMPRSSRGSKSMSKGGSVADVKEVWKNLTGGDIKEDHKPEPKLVKPEYRTVLGVLRHLTALEPQLGSLGPTVNKLLGKSLAMEKVKKESSEDILRDIENVVLLETIKEKFRGQLMAGIVERFNVAATKNAINNITWVLDNAPPPTVQERILKAEEAPKVAAVEKIVKSSILSAAPTAKPSEPKKEAENIAVPGVGNIDRNAIALQIASALLAQGKTDITNEELEQLVEAVVGMAQKKNAEAKEEKKVEVKEVEQEIKEEEVATIPEEEAPADMSEDDLISCLKIFEFLPEHEKHSIILQLQRLEETDPEKVKELRKFVNAGTEMNSPKELFGQAASDDEDYLDSDVLNAAKKNVEQEIKPKAADSKTLQEATDSMMAGLKGKRLNRQADAIKTDLPLPPIGNVVPAAPLAAAAAAVPQSAGPYYETSQNVYLNAFQHQQMQLHAQQPQQHPQQHQNNPYEQQQNYPYASSQYPQYGGPSYGYYHQNWTPYFEKPIDFHRDVEPIPRAYVVDKK
ncbi:uncharacterized protein CG7065-like isoform X1 [Cloeon dipterum]|uniref:uncharacterized protein CG7065-like isoform X1 n=1 Tax=Cloeon dipterum TaxID=197152 RepID=UPI0032204C70